MLKCPTCERELERMRSNSLQTTIWYCEYCRPDLTEAQRGQNEPLVKPANAFIEASKNAIDKAHTLALKYAVLTGTRTYNDNIYSNWQEAHIKFQEELKHLSV